VPPRSASALNTATNGKRSGSKRQLNRQQTPNEAATNGKQTKKNANETAANRKRSKSFVTAC